MFTIVQNQHNDKLRIISKQTRTAVFVILVLLLTLLVTSVSADATAVDFDSYALGTVNGQDGWSMTGPEVHANLTFKPPGILPRLCQALNNPACKLQPVRIEAMALV